MSTERTGTGLLMAWGVLVLLLVAWIWILDFVVGRHTKTLDAIEKRLHAVEQELWVTNGTLVITQDFTGSFRFSWPNVPATNRPPVP